MEPSWLRCRRRWSTDQKEESFFTTTGLHLLSLLHPLSSWHSRTPAQSSCILRLIKHCFLLPRVNGGIGSCASGYLSGRRVKFIASPAVESRELYCCGVSNYYSLIVAVIIVAVAFMLLNSSLHDDATVLFKSLCSQSRK